MVAQTCDLTIAKFARATGVKRETIRFYEQRGLISAPPRSAAGYRLYPPAEVRKVRFIKSAQTLGFSLDEIAELLALRSAPNGTCAAVKSRTEAKIVEIDRKIAGLAGMKAALAGIAASCEGGAGSTSECPILDALDADEARK
jgi:Cu(I)-responsive transcriptional regulator